MAIFLLSITSYVQPRHESATLLLAVSATEKVLTWHISYPALECFFRILPKLDNLCFGSRQILVYFSVLQ